MATELDELVSFLSWPSPNVRKAAVEIVEGLTGTEDGIQKLLSRMKALLPGLLRLLSENEVVAKRAAAALVNLSQDEDVAEKLVEQGVITSVMELFGKQGEAVSRLLVMLLVNLTNLDEGCRQLIQENDEKLRGLYVSKLVRFFLRPSDEGDDAYEHVGAILVNVTRLDVGRKILLDSKRGLLKLVLRQSDSQSLVRRRGVIGTVRNCCFEAQHDISSFLSLSDLLWPCLILPVAGKKIFSEEERSKMPLELSVPLSIERQAEYDSLIRQEALEAIYLLVMQDAGSRAFWQVGGPEILKAGYEYEEDPPVMDKYEQLGSLIISQNGHT